MHEEKHGFWEDWQKSQPLPPKLQGMSEHAFVALGLNIPHEVKMFVPSEDDKEWDKLDAVTETQYGFSAHILLNRNCGRGLTNRGEYIALTLLHEICHIFTCPMERLLGEAFDDDENIQEVLEDALHQMCDRLSYVLFPLVFPSLNRQEDLFDETV